MILVLILLVIGFVIAAGATGGFGAFSSDTGSANVNTLINADQFAQITPEELIAINGKPESTDSGNLTTGKGVFPVKYYYYGDGQFEFLVIDNAVVRLNIYPLEGKSLGFHNEKELFAIFGLKRSSQATKTVDNNVTLRYRQATDKVADFWVVDIDMSKSTFFVAKITYNLNYFD